MSFSIIIANLAFNDIENDKRSLIDYGMWVYDIDLQMLVKCQELKIWNVNQVKNIFKKNCFLTERLSYTYVDFDKAKIVENENKTDGDWVHIVI